MATAAADEAPRRPPPPRVLTKKPTPLSMVAVHRPTAVVTSQLRSKITPLPKNRCLAAVCAVTCTVEVVAVNLTNSYFECFLNAF